MLPIAAENLLDHRLPPIARGKVQVDVGPTGPVLGKEALEEELLLDGVDRRDSQGVTDRRVGRASPALDEESLAPGEPDQVPDDQEIACEFQFADEFQLGQELAAPVLFHPPSALTGSGKDSFPQERVHVVSRRHRKVGKGVAQVLQGEVQPVGDPFRIRKGFGEVCKEGLHFLRPFDMPFAVGAEPAPRRIQVSVLPEAGEDIHHLGIGRRGVEDAVCREEGQVMGSREIPQVPYRFVLPSHRMALNLDEDISGAERSDDVPDRVLRPGGILPGQGPTHRPFLVAGQGDQPLGELGEFSPGYSTLPLRGTELSLSEKAAEILVAGPRLDQDGNDATVFERDLRTDQRTDSQLLAF